MLTMSSEVLQQHNLECWAAGRVAPWGQVQRDDYEFCWANDAIKGLLEGGSIYECVRESWRLRGLLVLMNPKRRREPFEVTLSRTGRERYLPCCFEGLREEHARETLGGAVVWLRGYAGELADNLSFAELLRAKGDEVRQSLEKRPLRFPKPRAAQLAHTFIWDYDAPAPWPWQPWRASLFLNDGSLAANTPERSITSYGSEKVAIEVNWAKSNRKIGKEVERLARLHRPPGWEKSECELPEKIFRARLKALSVMRIWKRFPHRDDRWQRIEEVARCTGYQSCVDAFRTEGAGTSDAANAKMSRARDAALCFFRSLGTGEMPANWIGDLSTEVAQVVR
jgi:hypothetical protein